MFVEDYTSSSKTHMRQTHSQPHTPQWKIEKFFLSDQEDKGAHSQNSY